MDRLTGNFPAALENARQAINESPQFLEAYINEILVLQRMGDNAAAFRVADSLVLDFPDYLPGHYFKGKFLEENGQTGPAMQEFRFIIERGAKSVIERYDLSTIYSSQTEYGYKPYRMPGLAYYELGNIFVGKGQVDSALTCFEHATEILPEYADAWTNLALAYDYKKQYDAALGAYRKSLDLNPDNPYTLYNLGLTLGKLGLFKEAVEIFRHAVEIKPDFAEARQKLKIAESLLKKSTEQ